ncbi:methyltransferase domain-containing protein [Jatrophihabitans sp.]|uniref:class I SAM-dependent methyltransferase n=1 Tax=Jatrophihabitans sp. TaxID=1932789 RepID=UPI0030C757B3|nr:Methyltransferase type 12 [Jatrophihabitans sp.]
MAHDLRRDPLAAGRTGIVGQLLADALRSASAGGVVTPTVLDCGGGSGAFAVPFAQLGAAVTVVDISVDALATLTRRAAEGGVDALIDAVQGDLEALPEVLHGRTFDLVLAHGVLDVLDDTAAGFAAMASAVRPGGLLSVLVANPVAGVLGRALAGDLAAALRELGQLDAEQPGLSPETVRQLCAAAGLEVESVHGVGVFTDLVPGSALDAPGAREALAELEAATATRHPFADIAGRQLLLARRPGG